MFLDAHIHRLFQSMKLMRMTPPYTARELGAACIDLVKANKCQVDVHLRPTVYFAEGVEYGSEPTEISTGAFITAVPRGRHARGVRGLRCCVSWWTRISDVSMPPRLKVGANYHNSRLAQVEARLNGYDYALLLNDAGKVAEGPGACVFLRRGKTWATPSVTSGILESDRYAGGRRLASDETGQASIVCHAGTATATPHCQRESGGVKWNLPPTEPLGRASWFDTTTLLFTDIEGSTRRLQCFPKVQIDL